MKKVGSGVAKEMGAVLEFIVLLPVVATERNDSAISSCVALLGTDWSSFSLLEGFIDEFKVADAIGRKG